MVKVWGTFSKTGRCGASPVHASLKNPRISYGKATFRALMLGTTEVLVFYASLPIFKHISEVLRVVRIALWHIQLKKNIIYYSRITTAFTFTVLSARTSVYHSKWRDITI